MYHIKGMGEIISIIHSVCGLREDIYDLSDTTLQLLYYKFLKDISVFHGAEFSSEIKIVDFHALNKILTQYCEDNKDYYCENSEILSERIKSDYFISGLNKLNEQNSEIYQLANFVIKIINVSQLKFYTNGTTKDTIGLASINFKDDFDQQDFIELIVHQLTHMILFLDDYIHYHLDFKNKELMVEAGLSYRLGGTKFPLYTMFHSYVVGVEVLCFRYKSTGFPYQGNYHGSTSRIIKICTDFKNCLMNNIELFSPRGQSILNDSFVLFDQVSMEFFV